MKITIKIPIDGSSEILKRILPEVAPSLGVTGSDMTDFSGTSVQFEADRDLTDSEKESVRAAALLALVTFTCVD